jgi:hypothetical protein
MTVFEDMQVLVGFQARYMNIITESQSMKGPPSQQPAYQNPAPVQAPPQQAAVQPAYQNQAPVQPAVSSVSGGQMAQYFPGHQQNVYPPSVPNQYRGNVAPGQYRAPSGPVSQNNYIPKQQGVVYPQQQMNYAQQQQQQQLYYQQQNPVHAHVTQPTPPNRVSQQAVPQSHVTQSQNNSQMYPPPSSQHSEVQPQRMEHYIQLQDSTNVQNNSASRTDVFKKPAVPHSKPRSDTKENVSTSSTRWIPCELFLEIISEYCISLHLLCNVMRKFGVLSLDI